MGLQINISAVLVRWVIQFSRLVTCVGESGGNKQASHCAGFRALLF